jgi:hypothetical protein
MSFLTILSALWFVFMTCIGNFALIYAAQKGNDVRPKAWMLLVDLFIASFLIWRLIG